MLFSMIMTAIFCGLFKNIFGYFSIVYGVALACLLAFAFWSYDMYSSGLDTVTLLTKTNKFLTFHTCITFNLLYAVFSNLGLVSSYLMWSNPYIAKIIRSIVFYRMYYLLVFCLLYIAFIFSPTSFIGVTSLLLMSNYIFLILFMAVLQSFLKVDEFTFENFKCIILPSLITFVVFFSFIAIVSNYDILLGSCMVYFKELVYAVNNYHLLDFLENYMLCMDGNSPGNLSGLGEGSNTNPTPNPVPNDVIYPMPDEMDVDEYTDFTIDYARDKGLPYDLDTLYNAKGLSYDIAYMKGEKISYETISNVRLELTDLFPLNPDLVKPLTSIEGVNYERFGGNTYVASDISKEGKVSELDYKKIFKGKNFIRVSLDKVYPVLDYIKEYELHRSRIYASTNYLDAVLFTDNFRGYDIASDLRNVNWFEQLSKVKEPKAYESQTNMLHTTLLSNIFLQKDGYMFGPENRNVGGVADMVITKHGNPFAHVEYKSYDGEAFTSAFAQGKKYIYTHNSLKMEDLFGIYGKAEKMSFFIVKED